MCEYDITKKSVKDSIVRPKRLLPKSRGRTGNEQQ
jgi:hypothetical protein